MPPKYQALPQNAPFSGYKQPEEATRSCTVLEWGFLFDPKDASNKPTWADSDYL